MKRLPRCVVFVCLPLVLGGAQDGHAFPNVSPGCTDCHSFPEDAGLHATHAAEDCTVCHSEAASAVLTQSCIACHPRGAPGKCQLIVLPGHPAAGSQECLACHNPCTPVSTSTSSTTTSTAPCPSHNVLGEDNPAVDRLRDFRDSTLAQSAPGRTAIRLYYRHADSINAALERSPRLKAFIRRALEAIAPLAGRKEEAD